MYITEKWMSGDVKLKHIHTCFLWSRYDPLKNSWSKLTPMLRNRASASATVLNGQIYVVGGTDGDMPLDSGTQTHIHV